MKLPIRIAVCAIVVSSIGCRHQIVDVSPSVRAELSQTLQNYFEAANRSDTAALMDTVLHDPRVTSVANGQVTVGWDAIRDQVEQLNHVQARMQVTLDGPSQQFLIGPGVALVIAPYTFSVATPERQVTLHAATTLLLQKSGGRWKIFHEHNSALPPMSTK